MQKQTLTLENIRFDLRLKAKENKRLHANTALSWMFWTFVLFTVLWFIFLWAVPLPGIALAGISLFLGVRYVGEYRARHADVKALCTAIEGADLSIDVEHFSHITKEVIVEPHRHGFDTHLTNVAYMVYFESGCSWRKPEWISRLYQWSKTHSLSFEGLDNISLTGDPFYCVTLQGHPDVSYIYPAKFFNLDPSLKGRVKN